ncbi:hypothetical protein TIFTF001_009060 [Ficus carica]|uniref:Uncharacterized protein n=1 Tax=Ficus carica TaxID=3494 RepID=A0AA88D115_FICCA|nr:hypothetical protein TIFTF001_009060 [Ficus carica]
MGVGVEFRDKCWSRVLTPGVRVGLRVRGQTRVGVRVGVEVGFRFRFGFWDGGWDQVLVPRVEVSLPKPDPTSASKSDPYPKT